LQQEGDLADILKNRWVRRLAVLVLSLPLLGIVYYQYNYPTCTFRYKLTAEVMTPDGLKTGSSVIKVSYSHNADWGGGKSADLHMTGEAVYVDLGQGKNLFVTLKSQESGREVSLNRNYAPFKGALDGFALPLKVFGLRWNFGQERDLCAASRLIPLGTRFDVTFENLPTLVTFNSLDDPYSVSVIQPDQLALLGQGMTLKRVTVAKSEEQIFNIIDGVLPWLQSKRPKNGSVIWDIRDPLIDRLNYNSFKMPI
jgi:hypothetical protein